MPSPLVVALAPFEVSVTPRSEKVSTLIRTEIEPLSPPPELESASVYDGLVSEWDKVAK